LRPAATSAGEPELRHLAFLAVVVALVAVLVLTMVDRPAHAPTQGRQQPTARTVPTPSPASASARHAARRFVEAFLSFEVGMGEGAARKAIRAGADTAFARELLSGPSPPTAPDPGPAPIAILRVGRLPGRPGRALVFGTARRQSGPEPFAFLFGRRQGRWLAVAP
jgi:hypothetical protein